MDLLREKVGRLYTRYLAAAFGSALISSIYGMVDMAMVGQYQGPEGTAALAVSVARGALISGFLIQILPALLGGDALWLAMPITELVVALPVAALMLRDTRRMGRTGL